ncbi:hypothetical protein ALP50_05233 [Pseudomonas syringae pv. spinaceae]|nr:hypothetical protein ALP50_05233 [Pseudomonas syringae pv. spinaceae]
MHSSMPAVTRSATLARPTRPNRPTSPRCGAKSSCCVRTARTPVKRRRAGAMSGPAEKPSCGAWTHTAQR